MSMAALPRLAVRDETRQLVAVELEPEALAVGGDAAIHVLRGATDRVAKLYHDPAAEPRRRAKLDAMLAAPPEGRTVEHDGRRVVQLAWPEALLERDAGEPPTDELPNRPPAGFVMPRVDLAEAALLELLLSPRARRSANLPGGYRFRVAAARNLAAAVAALHAAGHYVVDLKPANVHVYRDTGFVAILDCDGFSVAGPDGERFPAHQYTDGYIAPEALTSRALPEALGESQDRFALAVIVFRLLNGGLHPFQGVPRPGADVPATNGERVAAGLYPYRGTGGGTDELAPPPSSRYSAFDAETQALFDRAFDAPPVRRPTAAVWRTHLSTLLDSVLQPCDRSPDHARYGDGPCVVCRPEPPPNPARIQAAMDRVQSLSSQQAARQNARTPFPRGYRSAQSRPLASSASRVSHAQALSAMQAAAAAASARTPTPSRHGSRRWGYAAPALLFLLAVVAVGVMILIGIRITGSDRYSTRYGIRGAVEYDRLEDLEYGVGYAETNELDAGLDTRLPSTASDDFRPYYQPLNRGLGYPAWRETDSNLLRHLVPGLGKPRDMAYLHLAALHVTPMSAAVLLRGGARPDGYQSGRTALMLAASNARTPAALPMDTVEDVLRVGRTMSRASEAYLDTRKSRRGPWPDTLTTEQIRDIELRLVPIYADYTYNATAASAAARQLVENAALVDLLLRHGATPDLHDAWGRTALHYAVSVGNAVTVRQLVDGGADPNAADLAGVTPLMASADRAATPSSDDVSARVVQVLLAAGADPSATDLAGRTAADFVGERAGSYAFKTHRASESDTTEARSGPLSVSRTLALLRTAMAGAPAEPVELASLALATVPPRVADVADGDTRFGFDPDTLDVSSWGLLTWAGTLADSVVTVPCEGVSSQRIEVDAWVMRRNGHYGTYQPEQAFYLGRLQYVHSPTWSASSTDYTSSVYSLRQARQRDRERCLREVQEVLAEEPRDGGGTAYRMYDLRNVSERWPHARVLVEVVETAPRGSYR